MMRDNTQIMLFIAHLPWDCGILTGMDPGAHGMVSSGFNLSSSPLFLGGYSNCLPGIVLAYSRPPFLFGIISEAPPQNAEIKKPTPEM